MCVPWPGQLGRPFRISVDSVRKHTHLILISVGKGIAYWSQRLLDWGPYSPSMDDAKWSNVFDEVV